MVAFYNQRGTAEQHIKEGKNAIRWTRLSCQKFRNNGVRLQLHALAYNLGNVMRTLALPKAVEHRSLTTLREKLVKIGAKVVSHRPYSKRGPIAKIMPSDGRKGEKAPLALGLRYDFYEFGCHLGNVGSELRTFREKKASVAPKRAGEEQRTV